MFTYQELELNKGDFTVKVGNTELPHITKQEFSILELLLKHPKKVFSKEATRPPAACFAGVVVGICGNVSRL